MLNLREQFFFIYCLFSINLTVAQIIKTTTVEFLKSKCKLQPQIDSPSDFLGVPTLVDVLFEPSRFVGIDDLTETMTIIGSVFLSWNDSCVQKVIHSPDFGQPNVQNFCPFSSNQTTFGILK